MRTIACLAILAALAPAQRFDCAPVQLSLPAGPGTFFEIMPWPFGLGWALHVIAPAGTPLVSSKGTVGTIPISLDLKQWFATGATSWGCAGVWAHFSPLIEAVEVPREIDFTWDGIKSKGCGCRVGNGDNACMAFNVQPALGGLLPPWPCDWLSGDGLRGRDIVVDSAGWRDRVGRLQIAPWSGVQMVEAWFEIR